MLQFRWSRATAVGIFLLAFLVVLLDATGDVTKISNKKKEVKIRNKREGSWSGWSSWSPCSRTCGGGIRTQTRQCQIRQSSPVPYELLLQSSIDGMSESPDGFVVNVNIHLVRQDDSLSAKPRTVP
ncbi:unnamed protein product [Allacma fusca]|uniref:Uncharacterized protein n=1 Tax=Allacma fusca TaxID=39272 RepID=A0A8J2LWB5_9HEXA|nr:unnamed protein product [Allacma fusca]